jgi:hypothetical protein
MKNISLFLLLSSVLILFSCKKKSSAGLGGNANLKVTAIHHAAVIDSCKVYIKFNSSEAVSLGEYELSEWVKKDSLGNSYVLFKGLKKGEYYIYGEGYDPSILNTVKGGIPYTIEEETDMSINLPVTEVH